MRMIRMANPLVSLTNHLLDCWDNLLRKKRPGMISVGLDPLLRGKKLLVSTNFPEQRVNGGRGERDDTMVLGGGEDILGWWLQRCGWNHLGEKSANACALCDGEGLIGGAMVQSEGWDDAHRVDACKFWFEVLALHQVDEFRCDETVHAKFYEKPFHAG